MSGQAIKVGVESKAKSLSANAKRAYGKWRANVGLAKLPALSGVVANAFGPRLGAAVMCLAILTSTGVSGTMLYIMAKGFARFLG